jgi:hypothetical protein
MRCDADSPEPEGFDKRQDQDKDLEAPLRKMLTAEALM